MLVYALAVVIFMAVYAVPGLFLARGIYAQAAREIASRPVQVIPPKPERPKYKLSEMLHATSPKRCNAIVANSNNVCDCKYRRDWENLKNGWMDYEEWNRKYGHIKNGVSAEPEVNMGEIYWSVIGWPLVAGTLFIKGGAKNIPDYRAIERLENEMRELS